MFQSHYKNYANKNYLENFSINSTYDTLNYVSYFTGDIHFGFLAQDKMAMWFVAPEDLIIKAIGYTPRENFSSVEAEVKIVKVNWTLEQLGNAGELNWGHYEAIGNGFTDITAFLDDIDRTGQWIDLVGSNLGSPFGEDIWSDEGRGVITFLDINLMPGYQWIETNQLGYEPLIKKGELFAVVIKNNSIRLNDDWLRINSSITPLAPAWKFYASGRFGLSDKGWWSRNYTFDFAVAIELIQKTLSLHKPIGGEILTAEEIYEIEWENSYVNSVTIEYSTNNGESWIEIISDFNAAMGIFQWLVPNTPSDNCLVKINDSDDSAIFDISSSSFTISEKKEITVVKPAGGEVLTAGEIFQIEWTGINISEVKIEHSIDGGLNWIEIISNISNEIGTFNWLVPNTPSGNCRIKISSVDMPDIFDINQNPFTIEPRPPLYESENNDSAEEANEIAIGYTIFGSISHPDDVDYFKFFGNAGDTIVIYVSHRNNSLIVTHTILLNEFGSVLYENLGYAEPTNNRIVWKIQNDGIFYIRVSSQSMQSEFDRYSGNSGDQINNIRQQEMQTNSVTGDYSLEINFFIASKPQISFLTVIRYETYNSVSIKNVIFPNAAPTSVSYELGTSTSYGIVQVDPAVYDNLNEAEVIAKFSGLQPNTIYHYRIKTINIFGTHYSEDRIIKTLNSPVDWEHVETNVENHLFSAFFLNESIGYAAGENIILKSSDEGSTWLKVNTGLTQNIKINDIAFISSGKFIAVGDSGLIIESNDAGNTWNVQYILSNNLETVQFWNSDIGIAAGQNILLKTTNGGQSWVELDIGGLGSFHIRDVKFINQTNIIAVGLQELIALSNDSGMECPLKILILMGKC